MNEEDVRRYREILEKEYSFINLKIETTLTYVSAGAIGFFVFMNTSYLKLQMSDFRFLLVISLSFLFLSLVLNLVRKSNIMKHEFEMLTFVERMQPNSNSQEQDLVSRWDRIYMNRTLIKTISNVSLALGIGLQLAFIVLNM